MSILDDLFESLTGDYGDQTNAVHPCAICPSDCAIAPAACAECQPYKERLIDALYNVDRIDEFRAQYEVVANPVATPVQTAAPAGNVECPYCGGATSNPYICDYCGMKLQDAAAPEEAPATPVKIQVASANDIPNPIMDAQTIIFERYGSVVSKYSTDNTSMDFLGNLLSFIGITEATPDITSESLGNQMSEDEIKEMAESYGVSVSAYLRGLDDGKYLTLTAKRNRAQDPNFERHYAQNAGYGGVAAAAAAGTAAVIGNNRNYGRTQSIYSQNPYMYSRPPQMYQGYRDPRQQPQYQHTQQQASRQQVSQATPGFSRGDSRTQQQGGHIGGGQQPARQSSSHKEPPRQHTQTQSNRIGGSSGSSRPASKPTSSSGGKQQSKPQGGGKLGIDSGGKTKK